MTSRVWTASRRGLRLAAALTLAVVVAAAPAPAARAWADALVSAVAEVGMTVEDLDRSVAFYRDVLDFEKISEVEVAGADYERLQGVFGLRMRIARMQLGSETIELVEYLAPRGRSMPEDTRANDRWFQHVAIIVSDMDRAYALLREHRVEHASSGPQTLPEWNRNAAGIRAFYFRDLDGHFLEILEFPPGKGDARWHEAEGRLFLGIDHTAIVVADTDESLAFYRDVLGLDVAGESENYGTEQEHLNNVFGARLRITTLRAKTGPGIELLEYLAPPGGRPTPKDLRANDIAHWQTRLVAEDLAQAGEAARRARIDLVSPGAVAVEASKSGFSEGLLVRDGDGHAMQLIAR